MIVVASHTGITTEICLHTVIQAKTTIRVSHVIKTHFLYTNKY